jgi:hypothetical protein
VTVSVANRPASFRRQSITHPIAVQSGDHHRRQMLLSKRRCCGILPHRHVAASINGISDAAVPVTP